MAAKTGIEWTQSTWSPITGCTKVSPGCDHCYAETMSRRLAAIGQAKYQGVVDGKGWTTEVRLHPEVLEGPFHWKQPRMIFVCSMSDLFHSKVPWDFIIDVFDTMKQCRQHTFQVLTKRPGRMAYFAEHIWPLFYDGRWPPNVWAGTSVESQKYAPRVECLLRVPAKTRFISAEPLLGLLDLKPYFFRCTGCIPDADNPICNCKGLAIHQIIAGGESGPRARPMDLDWARSLRDQCQTSGVPFFYKQSSGLRPGMNRELDGKLWQEMPVGQEG